MRDLSIFRTDKFTGLNESDASQTELKFGEAAQMVNWEVTSNSNIRTRPGIVERKIPAMEEPGMGGAIRCISRGYWMEQEVLFVILGGVTPGEPNQGKKTAILAYTIQDETMREVFRVLIEAECTHNATVFTSGNAYCFKLDNQVVSLEPGKDGAPEQKEPYAPLYLSGAKPDGGGEQIETLNMLSNQCKIKASGNNSSAAFTLPEIVSGVTKALVDNAEAPGSFSGGKFTFREAPAEGVNNVEFYCTVKADPDITAATEKFYDMQYFEYFNGNTDSRVFFYGDRTGGLQQDVAYYTGVPSQGSGLYVPLGNEIRIGDTGAPITAMNRQDNVLLAFTADAAYALVYEPKQLADGAVIPAFYVHGVSKSIGNEAPGQVQLINNCSRSIASQTVYEWKSATFHQDQRYTKVISDPARQTMRDADMGKIFTFDDQVNKIYYMFLNDPEGTVLCQRYDVEAWFLYRSDSFTHAIQNAAILNGQMYFANDKQILCFDPKREYRMDVQYPGSAEKEKPIYCLWASGYMHFDRDWLRKYSSEIWISTMPETSSAMSVTARTDRRNNYTVKKTGTNIFDWYRNMDYAHWAYTVARSPKMKRIKLKVKKFVYYQLVFEVNEPGARATVLSIDQAVRFAGKAK